jgi:hypothetical protein
MSDSIAELFGYLADRANYLTHLSWDRGYVYVEVPKTGCTSVKRMLQLAEHGYDKSKLPKNIHDRAASPLARPREAPARFLEALRLKELFSFTFVRDPFSRALSGYLDKIVENHWEKERRLPPLGFEPDDDVSFIEFLKAVEAQPDEEKDIHWAPQHHLLAEGRIQFDFVGRFETLRDSLVQVADRIGIMIEPSMLLRTTAHATGAADRLGEFYGDEEMRLVREIYAADFANYGYSTDLPVD